MGDGADMALNEIMDMDDLWMRGDYPTIDDYEDGGGPYLPPFTGFRGSEQHRQPLPIGTKLKHPCPECGSDMTLRTSKYGLFYGCVTFPKCHASHGAHKETGLPLGTPADKETKQWRIKAHDAFDTLWKDGKMKRTAAYQWMRTAMKLRKSEAHIGMFDIDKCKQLIDAVNAR